jgi:hypothetical protein
MHTRNLLAIPLLARSVVAIAFATGMLLMIPHRAEAHITLLKVIRLESPTFGGMSFGDVGPYEKITCPCRSAIRTTRPM